MPSLSSKNKNLAIALEDRTKSGSQNKIRTKIPSLLHFVIWFEDLSEKTNFSSQLGLVPPESTLLVISKIAKAVYIINIDI